MNKKTIISLVLIIIGVTSLVWWSKLADTKALNTGELATAHLARTQSALVLSETFYDFGRISMKDGNVSKTFTVSNSSGQDINLEKLSTSCMCTVAYIVKKNGSKKGPFGMPGHGRIISRANEIIKTGEERDIEVIFDPNAHGPAGVGLVERIVFLEDENKNSVEFKFRANVTP